MFKRLLVHLDNFVYKVVLKNLLKTSKLGYGVVVSGAESGVNFEHIYNDRSEGKFIIGKVIDRALLNLSAVKATRGRKEDIKRILKNEIAYNKSASKKTRVLDLASGGGRYLRELASEHRQGEIESICIDKDLSCVRMGRKLLVEECLKNLRFIHGDIFKLNKLRIFGDKKTWRPNVVIASGLFIYFNNQEVVKMLKEIYDVLPNEGVVIFSSYERLNTKKLMRKTMSTSSGEEWTLYYRQPEFWYAQLNQIGFRYPFISRDQWGMNNIVFARK